MLNKFSFFFFVDYYKYSKNLVKITVVTFLSFIKNGVVILNSYFSRILDSEYRY